MHMRIQKLNSDTKKNLLEDLLKRSPNNYGQYEQGVTEILANVHFLQSSAKQKTISKVIMQNSVRTAGLTVNRTEPFLGRRSLRFTESACMCREERQFIRLRY